MSSRGGGGDLHLRELLMEKTGEVHKLKAELDKYVNLLITSNQLPLIERLHHNNMYSTASCAGISKELISCEIDSLSAIATEYWHI